MIIDDFTLLSEFNELNGSKIHQHLKEQREVAIRQLKTSPTDRLANIVTGSLSVIDELLEVIETAHDQIVAKQERARGNAADPSKAF